MDFLNIDATSPKTVKESFTKIAEILFNDYQLQVNQSYYRLIDIEFYIFGEGYKDIYTHKHKLQALNGKWYFHGSGVDLTFGNEKYYGGILIRSLAKLSLQPNGEIGNIDDVVYGPINVKTEISSNFYGAFETNCNIFNLVNKKKYILSTESEYIIDSKRIGLNPKNDINVSNENFRYLLVLNDYKFNHKNIEKAVKEFIDGKNKEEAIKISMAILNYNVTK